MHACMNAFERTAAYGTCISCHDLPALGYEEKRKKSFHSLVSLYFRLGNRESQSRIQQSLRNVASERYVMRVLITELIDSCGGDLWIQDSHCNVLSKLGPDEGICIPASIIPN